MMNITNKQLVRAIYSQWDFQQALSSLTFLLEECNFQQSYSKVQLRRFRCFESQLIISLSRPFEQSRTGTTLSLKAFDIKLNSGQEELLNKILRLRKKVIAHSDEEEMHFRSTSLSVLDGQFNFPHFQFNEGLHLEEGELFALEKLLHSLMDSLATVFFQIAQDSPSLINQYVEPESLTQLWDTSRPS